MKRSLSITWSLSHRFFLFEETVVSLVSTRYLMADCDSSMPSSHGELSCPLNGGHFSKKNSIVFQLPTTIFPGEKCEFFCGECSNFLLDMK